ncbi:uncharacterized protein DDB_G0271670 [Engraulis encrasicolus]|uniref:uncharacterized protein DDB_G0271670 n=1 Tax=Engraulis encrasicolus TaxID=184585 RepID=UPI002FCF2586
MLPLSVCAADPNPFLSSDSSPQLLKEDEVESWLVWWAAGGALAVLVFLVGIMFLGTRILKASLIPTPSKYFDGLDSVYKGNFKAWLGSILTLDALGVEVLTEYTSPVEVVKKEPGKPCKSFSNKQYFQEEPQKTALLPSPLPFFEEESLEPCMEFSPYDDMGKDCVGFGLQRVNTGVDQDGCQSDITDCSVAERTITMAMTTTTISTTTSCSSSSSSCGTSCSSSSSCGTSSSSGISSMSGSINTSTTTSSSEKHGSISWSCSTVPNIGISCSASGGSSTSGGNVSISSSSASTDGGRSSCTANSSISCSSSSSGVSCTSGGNFSRLRMDLGPIQVCNDYESFTRLVHAGPQSPDSGVCMGSGEEDSREEEEGGMKGPWRTGFSLPSLQPLVHPCTVPYAGETGVDPVGPNLCSTPTGWSPHKQNPLDTYGQLQPCSDDYQPLQAS